VKVVALARGPRAAGVATQWLAQLQGRGADVALVTEQDDLGCGVPLRTVSGFRPLAVMRAVELEAQLRETDAVVAVGRRARLVMRLLPPSLRPEIPGLSPDLDPEQAFERARAAVAHD
jgi:hypothetical protein